MKKLLTKCYRNFRVALWILRHLHSFGPYSKRKWIKEARYNLGYDDVGDWF